MDGKLQEILLDYGLEGYGLYWYCLELIAGNVSAKNISFELEHDCRIIARNTGSTVQKVQEIMKRFIEVGLLENKNGVISCLKIAHRLDKSMVNGDMRKIVEKMKNVMTNNDSVMTLSENVMLDKNRLDKIRKEENNIRPKNSTNFWTRDAVLIFWNEIAKANGLSKLTKVTDSRLKKIESRGDDFVKSLEIIRDEIQKSSFLKSGKWFSFDWLVRNDENWRKLVEGNFRDSKPTVQKPVYDFANSDYRG